MTAPTLIAADRRAVEAYAQLRAGTFVHLVGRWKRVRTDPRGAAWEQFLGGLRVIESVYFYGDARELWHHVSVSRASRLPTWDDLKLVRADFIGDERECYQVFPPRDRWVNDNPNVLHLWCCLDRPDGVLPNFIIEGTI